MYDKRFLGMIGSVVDMDYLIRRLQQVSLTGLMPYVVDSQGRLVAAATAQYATGQDMSHFEIVRSFVDEGSKAQLAATREFTVRDGKDKDAIEMLGTYSPVTSLEWAVVVQKPREDAYRGIYEMQRTGRLLAWLAVVAGHIWPAQLGLRGGKGVSTSLMGLLVYDWRLATVYCIIFAAGLAALRRPVAASLAAFVLLPWASWWLGGEPAQIWGISVLAGMVILAHHRNLVEGLAELWSRRNVGPESDQSVKEL